MSQDAPNKRDRARALMMAALDGEVSDADRGELERLLEGDPELREEWRSQGKIVSLQRPKRHAHYDEVEEMPLHPK